MYGNDNGNGGGSAFDNNEDVTPTKHHVSVHPIESGHNITAHLSFTELPSVTTLVPKCRDNKPCTPVDNIDYFTTGLTSGSFHHSKWGKVDVATALSTTEMASVPTLVQKGVDLKTTTSTGDITGNIVVPTASLQCCGHKTVG